MTLSERANRTVERTLFLVSFFTYAYFYQAADQSTAARFDLIRSLLERGSLWIDGYCGYNTADIINLGGHYYSVKAPGGSYTGIIPWLFARWLVEPFTTNNESLLWALATHLTIVMSVSLLIALTIVVFYRLAIAFGVGAGRAAAIALVLAFGTILFPYATEMTGEPIAAGCLLISLYLLVTFAEAPGIMRAGAAGFLAGWAVLNDYPALLVAAAIGFYAFAKLPTWRDVAGFSVGAGIVAVLLCQYNWAAFGSPFFMSYMAYKLPGNTQFPEQAAGFVGLTHPKLRVLWYILIDPQRGLFFCNPVLLLAIPGLVYFWKSGRRAESLVTLAAIVIFVAFNGSYGESIISWGGGTATGPRQMAPSIPFFALTLIFLPASFDWIIGALGGLSALFMLAATSTNPHFPYEYDNPVFQYGLQHFMRADLGFNRDMYFGGGMIVGDTVSFNLGKVVGLPGPLQLLPLAAGWIVAALVLIKALDVWPDETRRHLGLAAVAAGIAALFIAPLMYPIAERASLRQAHGLLGKYYLGLTPDAPPRLVRVDSELDMNDVAAMGAMPFPSVAIWNGILHVPKDGLYRFFMLVDDLGWITIDGKEIIRDLGNTANYSSEGEAELTAGPHQITVGERNLAGGSSIHLLWQRPDGVREIIPSSVLTPTGIDY